MILKLVIIFGGTYILYRLAKFAIKKKLEKVLGVRFQQPEIKKEPSLVLCQKCGVHVSSDQAIKTRKGEVYCSKDCKQSA